MRVLEHFGELLEFVFAELERFVCGIERVLGTAALLRHAELLGGAGEGFVQRLVAELFAELVRHLAEFLRELFELLVFLGTGGLLRDLVHLLAHLFHRLFQRVRVAFLQLVEQLLHCLTLLCVAKLLRGLFESVPRRLRRDFFPQLAEILRLFVQLLRVQFALLRLHVFERLVELGERLIHLVGERAAFFLQLSLADCGELLRLGEPRLLLRDLLPLFVHLERIEFRQPQHTRNDRGECEGGIPRTGHPAQRKKPRGIGLRGPRFGL